MATDEARRAAQKCLAVGTGAPYEIVSTCELAEIIDRETGLPKLIAAAAERDALKAELAERSKIQAYCRSCGAKAEYFDEDGVIAGLQAEVALRGEKIRVLTMARDALLAEVERLRALIAELEGKP